VPGLIAGQAARAPDAVAVACGDTALSYKALDAHANKLARLLTAQGAGPESVVAVMMERGAAAVIALLAVLKSGAAYLPVDPDYPAERVAFMLADARPVAVLTTPFGAQALTRQLSVPVFVDGEAGFTAELALMDGADLDDSDRICPLRPAHPAYVIYTSGSTGVPKAVTVTHSGIPSFAAACVSGFNARPGSRLLQFASIGFDAFVLEWCTAFAAGATLVVPPPGPLAGEVLESVLRDSRITHALIPPSALATMVNSNFAAFATLIVGGEACDAELAARWSGGRLRPDRDDGGYHHERPA
jgi:non-ribosomal peptide synthetase component F